MRLLRKYRPVMLLLTLVILMSLLCACSTAKGTVTTKNSDSSTSSEKVMRIGELWAITDIDPVSDGTLIKEKALVTEVLCEVNDQFELVPGLADKWENTSPTTWVFTLKSGVSFHDGSPMDADAAAWSITNALKKNPTLVTNTKIEQVYASDNNSITIVTSEPNAEIPEYMHLSSFGIISSSSYDANDTLTIPIGTGPYKVDNFNISTGILTIVKNTSYYGTIPCIDKVIISGMTDSNTRSMALESGEVDFTCDLPFNELEHLNALDNARIEKYDTARTYCIDLNSRGLFADKAVRQAASLAINRETISSSVLYGCGTPCKSIYPPNMAWCNTDLDYSRYDLNRAKQLMNDAGWTDHDGDGYLDKDGQIFEFTLLTYTQRPGLPLIAEALQAQLKDLGMKVNVTTMDSSAISEHVESGKEWGMYLSGSATCMTPSCIYFLKNKYYSANNKYGYSSTEMDQLIDECCSTFDTAARYEVSKKIQALAMEDMPIIYVCNYGVAYGFNEKVSNFKFNPTAHDYMWNVDISIE